MDYDVGRVKNVCVSNLDNWVGSVAIYQDKEQEGLSLGRKMLNAVWVSVGHQMSTSR